MAKPHNMEWVDNPPDPNIREDYWHAMDPPSKAFLDAWKGKTEEVIDTYQPDLMWWDFALRFVQEHYKCEMLAHYYNRADEWGKEVVVTYKWHDLAPGAGVIDLELGRFDTLTYHDWITDTTVDNGHGWGYLKETEYKSLDTLVHYLVDNVSKNGYMLLNVGPKPNGEIPREAKELLTGMGKWLAVNGEAIYGTTAWMTYGEGPTQMQKAGYFMEDAEDPVHGAGYPFHCEGRCALCYLSGLAGQRGDDQHAGKLVSQRNRIRVDARRRATAGLEARR